MIAAACPADDELVRMVEGALNDASLSAIETHLDDCERCAALVAELGAVGPVAQAQDLGVGVESTEVPGARPPASAKAGVRKLASYQLDRRIAAGGMGEVWAAWDPDLEREVAVKLVRPERADDDRERARLLREARALAKLAHPNVLAVYDVGEVDGELYLATELVSGDTLANRGGASSDWRIVARLYVQAARGLAAAHAVGLVHRDVKPANLLVGADGRVRVADFGLAVRAAGAPATPRIANGEPEVTISGHIAGTPAYMAPEQRAGMPADARCDQFALALALTEGIDGRRPSAGVSVAALRTFFAQRRTIDTELEALCEVIARALAPEPEARFREMTELADAIEAIVGTGIVREAVTPPTIPAAADERALARVVTRTRRRIAVGGIAAGAVVIVAAVAIGWLGGSGRASATSSTDEARLQPTTEPQPTLNPQPQPNPIPTPIPNPTPSPSPSPIPTPIPTPNPTLKPNPSPSPIPTPVRTPVPSPSLNPRIPGPNPTTNPTIPGTTNPTSQHLHLADVDDASTALLEDVELAIRHRDPKACSKALATVDLGALSARGHRYAEILRAHCAMIGGACDEGRAKLTTIYAAENLGTIVDFEVDHFCAPDQPASRRRRLQAQAEGIIDPAACNFYVGPARALAKDADDSGSRLAAASILASIAKCMSRAERCDDAHGLLHEAGALVPAVDNPGELTSACR